jgi:hypothetical protein
MCSSRFWCFRGLEVANRSSMMIRKVNGVSSLAPKCLMMEKSQNAMDAQGCNSCDLVKIFHC